MSDKLEETWAGLRHAAVDYCLSLEREIVDDEQLAEEALRQAARDFAAEWLRAGGLAQQQKGVGDE